MCGFIDLMLAASGASFLTVGKSSPHFMDCRQVFAHLWQKMFTQREMRHAGNRVERDFCL